MSSSAENLETAVTAVRNVIGCTDVQARHIVLSISAFVMRHYAEELGTEHGGTS